MNHLDNVDLTNPAPPKVLERLCAFAPFPEDYLDFLRKSNGAEGFIGDNYVMLHPADDIERINLAANIAKSAPGLVIFGSDGGSKSYAFDLNQPNETIVAFYLIDIYDDKPMYCASSLADFFEYLSKYEE